MFCSKCGNEIQNGEKFCAKCGSPIEGETAPLAQNQQGVATAEKKDYKKIIMLVTILACVLLIAILAISKITHKVDNKVDGNEGDTLSIDTEEKKKDNGFKSIDAVMDAVFTAAYNNDVEAVVACFPKEMEPHAIQIYNDFRGQNYSTENGFFNFINLNPNNEYQYEIQEVVNLDTNPDLRQPMCTVTKQTLQDDYGLIADEVDQVSVASTGRYYQAETDGYVTDGSKVFMVVAKIGDYWYLVQCNDAWNSEWCVE